MFLKSTQFGSCVCISHSVQFSRCRVWLFATPWIAARQASLSITNSRNSPKLTSIESVMPSSLLILSRPLLLLPPIPPSIRVFANESTLEWGGQSIGVSALASVLPKKSQGWSPSEWTGWISLQSKGLSRFCGGLCQIIWPVWRVLCGSVYLLSFETLVSMRIRRNLTTEGTRVCGPTSLSFNSSNAFHYLCLI